MGATNSASKAGKKKMKIDKPKYVEKDWGSETWFANNSEYNYCGKVLEIKKGQGTSMHFHVDKHEVFYVLEGTLKVDWIDTDSGEVYTVHVAKGESMEMPQGTPHSLIADEAFEDVKLIEASTFHRDSDSYRLWKTNKPMIKA